MQSTIWREREKKYIFFCLTLFGAVVWDVFQDLGKFSVTFLQIIIFLLQSFVIRHNVGGSHRGFVVLQQKRSQQNEKTHTTFLLIRFDKTRPFLNCCSKFSGIWMLLDPVQLTWVDPHCKLTAVILSKMYANSCHVCQKFKQTADFHCPKFSSLKNFSQFETWKCF